MPVLINGEEPQSTGQRTYSGPKIAVTPYFHFPKRRRYEGDSPEKGWYPNKPGANGGNGIVCLVDIHVEIEGIPGKIRFNGGVIAVSTKGEGLVCLSKQTWDANKPNPKTGEKGANVEDWDFGPIIAAAVREEINTGQWALTQEELIKVFEQWENWAKSNDMELLDYYYEEILREPNPYKPAPKPQAQAKPQARAQARAQAAPAPVQAQAQAAPRPAAAATTARPAAGVQPRATAPKAAPVAVAVAAVAEVADETEEYGEGEQDNPFEG